MIPLLLFAIAVTKDVPTNLLEAGRYAEAEQQLRTSLAQGNSEDRAAMLNLLAIALHRQGRYEEAAGPLREALLLVKSGQRQPFEMVNLYSSIGVNRFERGMTQESKDALRKAMQYAGKLERPHHPDTAQALNNLGTLALGCTQYKDAETLYRQALSISMDLFGAGYPKTALVQENLARLYKAQGQFHEAESLLERVLITREKTLGPDHPDVARSLIGLSAIRILRNEGADAERLAARAVRIATTAGSPGQLYASALAAHGNALRAVRRYREAESDYEAALPLLEQQHGPMHSNVAALLMNLAGTKKALHKDEEAALLVDRALQIRGKAGSAPGS